MSQPPVSSTLAIAMLWALFGSTSLCAATQPLPEQEVRFAVFGFSRIPNLALAHPGGDLQPIRFYSNSISPLYHYHGPSPLRFFHFNGEAEMAADQTFLPVAQLNFAPLGQELLLVFAPRAHQNANGERTYGIFPIDLDPASFPPGSLIVFNALGRPIAGTVGGERFQVRTGPSPVFAIHRQAQVQVATQFEERTAIIHRGPVEVSSRERCILFLLPPFVSGSVEAQYRFIRIPLSEDFPGKPEPKSP